jgi:hypothetical protein
MNIDDLTLTQIREIHSLSQPQTQSQGLDVTMIGHKVIIRTYTAGVWYAELSQKSGDEVILKDAYRMWE